MGKEKKQDTNRNYKDTVFQLLFSDKEKIVELYNALEDADCDTKSTEVSVQTLETAIFNGMINDLAFQVNGQYILLVEHQSTVNENMPLRMFLYLGRILEKTLDLNQVHKRGRMKISTPHLYVLYNGEENYPEEQVLKLSESYERPEGEPYVEVKVKILNINKEKGAAMLEKSRTLCEYSSFVAMVRERLRAGQQRDEAIRFSIGRCVEQGILKQFLEEYGEEVASRLFKEYTIDDIVRIRSEEAMEDGMKKGLEKGLEQGMEQGMEQGLEQGMEKALSEIVLRMKGEGFDLDSILRATGLPREAVEKLLEK